MGLYLADLPYLALETSGPTGSVAVGVGGELRAEAALETLGNHASELIPRVADVLADAGLSRTDLAGIVVGSGPGSFTGVRIAAATGKGLAHALGVPLWAFSSLEAGAVATSGEPGSALRYVLFDARADRVYGGCYRWVRGGLETVVAPHASRIGELLQGVVPGVTFMGTGALRHEALLISAGHPVLAPPAGTPSAGALLRLLHGTSERAPIDRLSRWEPEYVKESSAERPRVG